MLPQETGQTQVFVCDADDVQFTTRTGPGELAVWLPPRFGRPYLVLGQGPRRQRREVPGRPGHGLDQRGRRCAPRGRWGDVHRLRERPPARRLGGRQAQRVGLPSGRPGAGLGASGCVATSRRPWASGRGSSTATASRRRRSSRRISRRKAARLCFSGASTDGRPFTLTLDGRPCTDTMSGEAYETTVAVTFDGETFRGCGQALH